MSLAITRVEQAKSACREKVGSTIVVCHYAILARPPGGSLGENIWTVRLVPGAAGTLQSATVERSHVGMPGYISG